MTQLLWTPFLAAVGLLLFAQFICRSRFLLSLTLGSVLLSSVFTLLYLISDRITGEGINYATLFHLRYGFDAANLTRFPLETLVVTMTLGGVGLWIALAMRRASPRLPLKLSILTEGTIFGALFLFAVAVHPSVLEITRMVEESWSPFDAQLLGEEMARPGEIGTLPAKPKSLVYIYVESFERTLFDERLFPSLVTRLKTLEAKSLSIRGIRQAPMTDWTIAGMVASQCGIPLATLRWNINNFSEIEHFVPGATCLGNLLGWAGYRNVYIGGADLAFAGKNRFYADHGFHETHGLAEIESVSSEPLPLSKWGVYDDALFDFAFNRFTMLAVGESPFALVILTLDTHPPSGHVNPACRNVRYADGQVPMLNAIKCADGMVADFVERIDGYVRDHVLDVLVIVASDHLLMRNDISDVLETNTAIRENLFLAHSADLTPGVIQRESSTLDLAPTVLSLLGWDVDAMALGRNLQAPAPTLVEKYGRDSFFKMVKQWRLNLMGTWRPASNGDENQPEYDG